MLTTTAQFSILQTLTAKNGSDYGKGTDGQFLRTSGTSTYWSSLATSDITSGVLTVARGGTNASSVTKYGVAIGNASANGYAFTAAGTDGYIFIGKGANTAPTWQEILPIGHGGTGTKTAPTKGGVIYASETTTYASTAAGTTGQVLRSNGTGTPTWEMSHAVNEFTWTSDITYEPTTNTFTNTRANNNWASQVYSKHGFSDGCYMSFRAVDKTHNIMVGLNSDPTANANWTSIDYCWYLVNDGGLQIRESNSGTISPGTGHTTYAATDDFRIEYSHGYIRYYHNGVCCRAVARAISGQLYFDSSFYNAGAICDVRFGAISNENSPEIYLTCTTAAETAAKTVTVAEDATLNGFQLIKGMTVNVKFNNINSVNNPTLEIAGTGAEAIYYRGTRVTYQGLTNTIVYCLLYDGSQWQITNEIPPAFGSCTTAVGTAAKAVTINGFIPYAGAHVFVRFTKRNTALTPTLNINSQGKKSMYNLGRNTGTWFYTFDDTSYYEFVYDGSAYRLINNVPSMYATLGRTAHAAVVNPDTGEETTPAVTQIHGVQLLTLGNATTSTTDSGLTGILELYNAGTKSIQISAELNTAGNNRKWYLPNLDTNRYFVTHSAATALGSNTKPIKLDANGSVSECSTYAGGTCITLNEVSKAATTASFYAPTSITASRLIYSNSASTLASTTISSDGSYLANVSYLTINGNSQTDYRLKVDGSTNITGTLYLTRTTDAEATADNRPALMIGDITGTHLEFDGNEIMAKASATTTSALYLNNNGGNTKFGGNVGIKMDPTYVLDVAGHIRASSEIYTQTSFYAHSNLLLRYNDAWWNVVVNYGNGNTGLNACGGGVYMGYSNTTLMDWLNGRMSLSNTGSLTLKSSASNKATLNVISIADVPNDFYLGSNNAGKWSITCRASGESYFLGFYSTTRGWNFRMYHDGNNYNDGELHVSGWVRFPNWSGIYSPNNSAHFYPNNSSTYGTWTINGSKNGYYGINLAPGATMTVMCDGSGNGGLFCEGSAWPVYYYRSGGRLGLMGSDTSSGYSVQVNGSLYVTSTFYAPSTCYTDSVFHGHSFWADRTAGERSVGVDYGTSGTIYFYSNGGSKGIYSGTGFYTGSLLYVDGNGATWYGQQFRARSGNVKLVAANGHRAEMQGDRNFVIYDAGGGAVWSTGTNSSIKVKENIKSLDDYDLINFKKLHTISFNYKPEMKMMYNDKKYGLIAEEVLQLYPNLVRIPPEYSDEKFDINKGMNQYHITLDYEGFIPLLIKMVQKQQDEIDELKQKLKCD